MWRASPRWAAVKGDGCIEVDQYPQAKSATQAEAAKARIENCSKEDADELMPAQPEELDPLLAAVIVRLRPMGIVAFC